jgi:hypothetical protein
MTGPVLITLVSTYYNMLQFYHFTSRESKSLNFTCYRMFILRFSLYNIRLICVLSYSRVTSTFSLALQLYWAGPWVVVMWNHMTFVLGLWIMKGCWLILWFCCFWKNCLIDFVFNFCWCDFFIFFCSCMIVTKLLHKAKPIENLLIYTCHNLF